jgi:hypothetical protein
MPDLKSSLERVERRVDVPQPAFDRLVRRRHRKRRNQRIGAGLAGAAVFGATLWVLATGGPFDPGPTPLPQPPATKATPSVGARDYPTLPLPGEAVSLPRHGELVLYLDGSFAGGTWGTVRVYEDGRIIWWSLGSIPEVPNGPTGLYEQRLAPAWIEYLRSEFLSTGLFDHDRALAMDADAPNGLFLDIRVRNGDRLVHLTWARAQYYLPTGQDVPVATQRQVDTLASLHRLLTGTGMWPTEAWEEQRIIAFVPSSYQVCLRNFAGMDPTIAMLPDPIEELLRTRGDKDGDCYEVSTEDARTIARAFTAAGYEPPGPQPFGSGPHLGYDVVQSDDPDENVTVQFWLTLPDGEGAYLGPG